MAHHHHHSSQEKSDYWQQRTAQEPSSRDGNFERPAHYQAFKHTYTSMGVAGHIVHMAGIFVPMLAGELIDSPQKYKKVVRLASIGTAMAYEGIHVYNEAKRRREQEAKLAECQSRD